MKITRELALSILKYCHYHREFYFPFSIQCREYIKDDDNFSEVPVEDWAHVQNNKDLQTFELWENLQNLDYKTTELLSRGFIEVIRKSI